MKNVGTRTETILYIVLKFQVDQLVSAEEKRVQTSAGKWNKQKKERKKEQECAVTIECMCLHNADAKISQGRAQTAVFQWIGNEGRSIMTL